MGLFKDFKDDFAQATNELFPGGEEAAKPVEAKQEPADSLEVDTLSDGADVANELSKLDDLLEKVNEAPKAEPVVEAPQPVVSAKPTIQTQSVPAAPEVKNKENTVMSDTPVINPAPISDEVSVITENTNLTGDLTSTGSFEIRGVINGNVKCNGKITVTGTINGNSNSSEFFADVAKVEGEVVSTGTVKIGTGSVIIGNITASSAVIAGAVKGDIDVQGPVVVDTSAVIMGNIKSRSVQINNGAVIEGFCSQCYADVDVQGLFDK